VLGTTSQLSTTQNANLKQKLLHISGFIRVGLFDFLALVADQERLVRLRVRIV